jgi:hypothetical protein
LANSFSGIHKSKIICSVLATAALWVRIQASLNKYKMGDISEGKEWPTHYSPPKKYTKKYKILSVDYDRVNYQLSDLKDQSDQTIMAKVKWYL